MKGDKTMNQDLNKPVVDEIELEEEQIEFEPEGEPDEPQVDTVWERDGRGLLIKREVPDDD